jgi:ABC-type transporter Mla subunit MlaD
MDQLVATREETDRMRTLADDVAVAFGAKLSGLVVPHLEAFPDKVEASLKPVVQAIESMGVSIGDGAKRGIQDTVQEMLQGMSSAAGKEMQSVVEALKSAADELKTAQGTMGSSGDHFGLALKGAADGITASVAKMTDAVERKLGDLEGGIGRVDDVLGRSAASISGISASMSDAARLALEQALRTVSDEAARAAEGARAQSQAHMEPLLAGLRDLVVEIHNAATEGKEHLMGGGKAAADTLSRAATALGDRLSAASSEASSNLAEAAASMTERMNAAVEQFRQIETAVAGHVHHLRRTGETISVAGNAFGAASERLRQAAEPVSITLERVEASARHATETLRVVTAANDTMREASARLTEVSRTASEVFNSYQGRFEDTDRALGTTVQGLVNGSIQLSGQFSEVVGELDRHLAEAVGRLREGVQEIQEMTLDLSEIAGEMKQVVLSTRVAAE